MHTDSNRRVPVPGKMKGEKFINILLKIKCVFLRILLDPLHVWDFILIADCLGDWDIETSLHNELVAWAQQPHTMADKVFFFLVILLWHPLSICMVVNHNIKSLDTTEFGLLAGKETSWKWRRSFSGIFYFHFFPFYWQNCHFDHLFRPLCG